MVIILRDILETVHYGERLDLFKLLARYFRQIEEEESPSLRRDTYSIVRREISINNCFRQLFIDYYVSMYNAYDKAPKQLKENIVIPMSTYENVYTEISSLLELCEK